MNGTHTTEAMTAEVRVITIGASQRLTLSMYRQLDWRRFDVITLFGRVHAGTKVEDQWGGSDVPELELIGRDKAGNLVRSYVMSARGYPSPPYAPPKDAPEAEHKAAYLRWEALMAELRRLPLIVLGR